MNKILIVGHPNAGHTQVEELLFQCGMKPANPSRRDGLTAREITLAICRGMGVPEIETIKNPEDFVQITPGTIWDGLLLGLTLGNLEHELWGWADSQALLLLEYFEKLDEQLTFVLVYDDPKSVLLQTPPGATDETNGRPCHERLDHWVSYNSELLHFFLRHRSRCILVHSRGVRQAAEKYLSMLQARLSAPLQSPDAADGNPPNSPDSTLQWSAGHSEWLLVGGVPDGTLAIPDLPADQAARDFLAEDAESFLVDSFLASHPASRQLFEELQASSNLQFDPGENPHASPESAWNAFLRQRWFAGQLMKGLQSRASEVKQLETELAERSHKCGQVLDHLQESIKQVERLQSENRSINELLAKATQDREQLVELLHHTQEQLESRFLQNREASQPSSGSPAPTGAADRVKSQLSYRIGSLMVRRSKSLTGLLGLPVALWKEKKSFVRERSQNKEKHLPPIHEYADAHLAEQVKKQLSYRLGSVVVRDSKSPLGWLRMPFSILWCIQSFHQQRESGR
jgi:hypothetical protein